jgi:hypothetical protein
MGGKRNNERGWQAISRTWYLYSSSAKSFPNGRLCFSGIVRRLSSTLFTAGTAPIAARDMVFTALVALKVLFFFRFFPGIVRFNHN